MKKPLQNTLIAVTLPVWLTAESTISGNATVTAIGLPDGVALNEPWRVTTPLPCLAMDVYVTPISAVISPELAAGMSAIRMDSATWGLGVESGVIQHKGSLEAMNGRDGGMNTEGSERPADQPLSLTLPEAAAAGCLLLLALRNSMRHPQIFHIGNGK